MFQIDKIEKRVLKTNGVFLVLFAVFASTILLTQIISSADAAYSEERKKAKEREKSLVDAQEKKKKDKTKKMLNAEKKAIDAVASAIKTKEPKGKSSTDSTNAARLKVIKDAKAAYDVAETALEAAEKAHKADKVDATKKQTYLNAKKAFEKAKIDRELAKLG